MAADHDLTPSPLTDDQLLLVDDDRFNPENVCLVTGAASGIGRATVVAMAHNGCTVVGTDVNEAGLNETAALTADLSTAGSVEMVAGDLRTDVPTIVDAAAEHGRVRFLANVAGLQHVAPIEEFAMEKYDEIHDVMLRAPLQLAKLCLPHMREAGGGAIGNMASVHGHYVTADKVGYNIVKFGIRGLTQSIAAEGEGDIRSFSVSTGYVKTPLVTGQIPDTAAKRGLSVDEVVEDVMLGQSRVKAMMDPVDVANLFTFGFSKHASHLNGGDLLFDGGMTLTYE